MTKQEIQAKISEKESKLTNPSVPESLKTVIKAQIEKLKSELDNQSKEEKKIDSEIKKVVKEEEKAIDNLDTKVQSIEKQLKNPSVPDSLKTVLRKKLSDIKEKKQQVKKELESDKKEIKKKEAVAKSEEAKIKKVTSVAKAKEVAKKVIKAKKEVVAAKKKSVVSSTKRTKGVRSLLSILKEMMKKDENLKARYRKQLKNEGGVDLKRDAERKAMKAGWRKSKETGNWYYEDRFNRSDKYKGKYPYFEDGGDVVGEKMYKMGGAVQNKRPYLGRDNYSKKADKLERAKPVGYRYTDAKAKKLGVKPYKKPTEEHILKGKGVYWENRIDKSDKKPAQKLAGGGILSPMTGGLDANPRFSPDSNLFM